MRFLFVNRLAGSLIGGGENFMIHLMSQLSMRGHDVTFLTARPLFLRGSGRNFGVQTILLRIPYIRYWGNKIPGQGLALTLSVLCDLWIFRIRVLCFLFMHLRSHSYDALVHNGDPWLATTTQKFFHIPSVVRMPGPASPRDRRYLRSVRAVIANGDVYRRLKKFSLENLHFISPGIDEKFFHDPDKEHVNELRKNLGISQHPVALFVGRLTEIKNIELLLRSWKILLEKKCLVTLVVLGDGEQKTRLKRIAEDEKIQDYVRFVNAVYGDDLLLYYALADFFVLSSHYDNFPQVINEAMAAGLPVVATDVGGVGLQVIHEKTGFLIPAGDAQKFANKVADLVQSSELRRALGEAGQKQARAFTWVSAAELFEKIF